MPRRDRPPEKNEKGEADSSTPVPSLDQHTGIEHLEADSIGAKGEADSSTQIRAPRRWNILVGHIDTSERSNEAIYVEDSDDDVPLLLDDNLTLAMMLTMTLPALLSDITIPITGLVSSAVMMLSEIFQIPRTCF